MACPGREVESGGCLLDVRVLHPEPMEKWSLGWGV